MSDDQRTAFAAQAIDLSELFRRVMAPFPLGGALAFHPQLTVPEGPSTGGGVQSTQHITIVSEDGTRTVVIGNANQATRRCQLRTFDQVDAIYRRRFDDQAVPVREASYNELLTALDSFFARQGFVVSREPPPTSVTHDTPPRPGASRPVTPAPRPARRPEGRPAAAAITGRRLDAVLPILAVLVIFALSATVAYLIVR